MRLTHTVKALAIAMMAALTGCATTAPYDYSALRASKPRSILVLPPLNQSPEVTAAAGVLSQITLPLAEAGYYVLPVAATEEMFRQNGIHSGEDAQELPVAKLQQIFGADSALYLNIRSYGTSYAVISSASVVTLDAKLVDLRTGTQLWSGSATASSAENQSSGGGLVGLLVTALLNQILDTVNERSVQIASVANHRLVAKGLPNGLLSGPRSPDYGKEMQPR